MGRRSLIDISTDSVIREDDPLATVLKCKNGVLASQ
jgi:hypothetical protein